jgi:hypothetical protein
MLLLGMQVCGAYAKMEDGEERYFAILLCECHIPIPVLETFENDIPCPLHEEHRYTGNLSLTP